MKFAIVVLSYNQPDLTTECLKSILALCPRQYSQRNIFVIHNGSEPPVIEELQNRFDRFSHVVLSENVGFAGGANAGLRVAFQASPWVLFLTQDTQLMHFPKGAPFEPCLAAVKVYKRDREHIGSMGGAVDVEIAEAYYCQHSKDFWRSFEDPTLTPFVPRTAFWIHQQVFDHVKGFDERLVWQWEDVDISARIRRAGELLQLDEGTEILHTKKGWSRKDPLFRTYFGMRNRIVVCRRYLSDRKGYLRFYLSMIAVVLQAFLQNLVRQKRWKDIGPLFAAVRDSFKNEKTYGRSPWPKAQEAGRGEGSGNGNGKGKGSEVSSDTAKTRIQTDTEESVRASASDDS